MFGSCMVHVYFDRHEVMVHVSNLSNGIYWSNMSFVWFPPNLQEIITRSKSNTCPDRFSHLNRHLHTRNRLPVHLQGRIFRVNLQYLEASNQQSLQCLRWVRFLSCFSFSTIHMISTVISIAIPAPLASWRFSFLTRTFHTLYLHN